MRTGVDDQRGGLRRTWVGLRRRLYRPQSGFGWEGVERPQQLRMRSNQTADDVSWISGGRFGTLH